MTAGRNLRVGAVPLARKAAREADAFRMHQAVPGLLVPARLVQSSTRALQQDGQRQAATRRDA